MLAFADAWKEAGVQTQSPSRRATKHQAESERHDREHRDRRRSWLAEAAASAGWRGGAATGLLLLDGVGAIGFAAALGGGLTALPRGLTAALPWLALGGVAAIARGGVAHLSLRLGTEGSALTRSALRRRAVVACFGLQPGARKPVGELMAVAIDGVEAMDGYVARFLPARGAAAVVPMMVAAATAVASPVSAAILLGTLVPFIAVMTLVGGAAAEQSRRHFAALTRLSGLFADRVRALPLVLAFQAERAEACRLGAAAEELRRRTMGVLRVAFLSSAGLEFFAALSVALVAVYVGFDLLGLLPFPAPEKLTLARGVFVLALAPEFYLPMRRLAAAYHDRQAAETAADRLMELTAARQAPAPTTRRLTAPRICFDGVTIRYPGEDRPVLEDFELLAEPGEIVALLGPSGAGKTSVLNLLLGLAPLAGGEVWIGGDALSALGSLARSVAWIGQAPLIRAGSIAENIAFADCTASRRDIEAAAERAGLGPVLQARPGGLDAAIDERGGGLSGGERRRIALARVLLKRAPILLLDEPTAHLDRASEQALLVAIRESARECTTIMATHSEAATAIAHRIVRIDSR